MEFWLLSKSVVTVVEGACDFDVTGSCRCARIFELLLHLGAGACTAILLKNLYSCNFLLLEGPSCFGATAVHEVFIGFLYRLLQNLREEW